MSEAPISSTLSPDLLLNTGDRRSVNAANPSLRSWLPMWLAG